MIRPIRANVHGARFGAPRLCKYRVGGGMLTPVGFAAVTLRPGARISFDCKHGFYDLLVTNGDHQLRNVCRHPRLRGLCEKLNLAAFCTNISNCQALVTNGSRGVLCGYLANAGVARTQGLDADFSIRAITARASPAIRLLRTTRGPTDTRSSNCARGSGRTNGLQLFSWVRNLFHTDRYDQVQVPGGNRRLIFGPPDDPHTSGLTVQSRC